jgi:hypothetical protein
MKIRMISAAAAMVLLALALASSGCESTPLLATSGSVLTLLASPATATEVPSLDPTGETYFSTIFGQLLSGSGTGEAGGGTSTPLVDRNITFAANAGQMAACSSETECNDLAFGPVTVKTNASGVVYVRLGVTEDDPALINIEAISGTVTQLVTVNNPLGEPDTNPTAAISAIPTSPAFVNALGFARVVFTSESTDPDDDPITCYWWQILSDAGIDYGDQIGSGSTYTRDFAVEDSMQVVLRVTDDPDAEDQCDSNTIFSPNVGGLEYLVCTNQAPVALIGPPEEDDTQLGIFTATVDGSGSTDPENTMLSYSWDCGNGDPITTGSSATCEYTRTSVTRNYDITLTVTDRGNGESDCSLTDTDTARVRVTPFPGG